MIIRVAVKLGDTVFIGKEGERHDGVLLGIINTCGSKMAGKGVHGFIDDKGNFFNRHEAAKHAFKCDQLSDEKCPDIIISEDLW